MAVTTFCRCFRSSVFVTVGLSFSPQVSALHFVLRRWASEITTFIRVLVFTFAQPKENRLGCARAKTQMCFCFYFQPQPQWQPHVSIQFAISLQTKSWIIGTWEKVQRGEKFVWNAYYLLTHSLAFQSESPLVLLSVPTPNIHLILFLLATVDWRLLLLKT